MKYYERRASLPGATSCPFALIYLPETAGKHASDVAEFKRCFARAGLHDDPEVDETEIEHEILLPPCSDSAGGLWAESEVRPEVEDLVFDLRFVDLRVSWSQLSPTSS